MRRSLDNILEELLKDARRRLDLSERDRVAIPPLSSWAFLAGADKSGAKARPRLNLVIRRGPFFARYYIQFIFAKPQYTNFSGYHYDFILGEIVGRNDRELQNKNIVEFLDRYVF